MANALYDTGRNAFLRGDLSWNSHTFKVVLLSSSYTVNLASHQYLTSIPGGARVATSISLTTSLPGVNPLSLRVEKLALKAAPGPPPLMLIPVLLIIPVLKKFFTEG